jgi:hypothetical protein
VDPVFAAVPAAPCKPVLPIYPRGPAKPIGPVDPVFEAEPGVPFGPSDPVGPRIVFELPILYANAYCKLSLTSLVKTYSSPDVAYANVPILDGSGVGGKFNDESATTKIENPCPAGPMVPVEPRSPVDPLTPC